MNTNINPFDNRIFWNPWHGCHKYSEGCARCSVFEADINYGVNTNNIKLSRSLFRLPVQRVRNKKSKYELDYKIPSGSHIVVCDTSDFFIEEADIWRLDAWKFIHERKDCLFEITTKRPERIKQCLPDNWLGGWKNVIINVSVENSYRAWERIPILLDLNTVKHKGIEIKPMLEYFDIWEFLSSGEIEQVILGGESYNGMLGNARALELNWVRKIREQCKDYGVRFIFHNTGSKLVLDTGMMIDIDRKIDEYGLSKFYKLDKVDTGVDWVSTVKELEMQHLEEQAHMIYKKICNIME